MIENLSPWIIQLKRKRPIIALKEPHDTEVAVIGGGIAGISTAYFILCSTNKKVSLFEADKLAHGATGHNAGQVVAYFEKPFNEIVTEFGLERALEAQREIHSGWELLDSIYDNANLQTPFHRFTGYAGCLTEGQIMQHLENKYLRHKGGINIDHIMIADNVPWIKDIDPRYEGLYTLLDHKNLLTLLETDNPNYCGLLSTDKGALNSALFTEELAGFLLTQFKDRFSIYEESPISEITLDKDSVSLKVGEHTITSKEVVLCTNGYKNFEINSHNGFDINRRFQLTVRGVVGYMAGYIEPLDKTPIAISYFTDTEDFEDPYYYLTRRPYEVDKNLQHNLTCIGGPEYHLEHRDEYNRDTHEYAEKTLKEINRFLRTTYKPVPRDEIEFKFHWHGLMGYTKNNLRLVGREPCNKRLYYNLGCNGVGILPSVFGGKRVSQLINGEKLRPSVFDPVDTRCMIK
jgi:glycine/D-amino acid oxidase-like deaminating enzyme